jgi:hypothetical protein
MWVGEATVKTSSSHAAGLLSERIVVVGSSRTVDRRSPFENIGPPVEERRSPVENIGAAMETVVGQHYAVDPAAGCKNVSLWRVDPRSLRSTLVKRVRLPFNPCLSEGYRSVAGTGHAVFVLEPQGGPAHSVLYRVEP